VEPKSCEKSVEKCEKPIEKPIEKKENRPCLNCSRTGHLSKDCKEKIVSIEEVKAEAKAIMDKSLSIPVDPVREKAS